MPLIPLALLVAACTPSPTAQIAPAGGDTGAPAEDTVGRAPGGPGDTEAVVAGGDTSRGESAGESAGDSAACEALIVEASIEQNPFSAPGAVIALTTCEPTMARVAFGRVGAAEQRTRLSGPGRHHRIEAIGMRADTDYQLRPLVTGSDGVEIEGEAFTFRSPPAPEGVPTWQFTLHEPERVREGHTLFGPGPVTEGAYLVGFDAEGHLTWYYQDPSLDGVYAADRQVRPLDDGDLLIAVPVGWRVISPAGETRREFSYPELGLEMLHHDAAPLPGGGLLLLSGESRSIEVEGEEVAVFGDVVVEVDASGEVVGRWSTFDHLDTQRFPGAMSLSAANDGVGLDWTHANGLVYAAEDDSFLLSLRNQSWIIKVDRASGEVLWRLGDGGDFALESGEWFYSQHAPEVADDGTMLLYDNGNERDVAAAERYSRAVRYSLDEEALTARQVWEFVSPFYNGAMGDANTLPGGEVLICTAGNLHYPVSPALITERDGVTGEPLWDLVLADVQVYRVDWLPGF